MRNTAARGHPVHFPRTNDLLDPQTIPVCHLSCKNITDSGKPDMRMWQYIERGWICRYIRNGPCMIHKNKRTYHSAQAKGKNAFYFDCRTDGSVAGLNDYIEHRSFLRFANKSLCIRRYDIVPLGMPL